MKKPNILFFFPDQHRHDWLGANPELPLRMPHLDAVMEEGVRWTRCYTPSPLCSPARACLATGIDYTGHCVRGNHENTPLDVHTYYRLLRDAGYQVSGVGKFDLHKADADWGLDGSKLLDEYGFSRGCDSEGKGDAISSYRKNNKAKGPYMHHLEKRGLIEKHLGMYQNQKGLCFSAISPLPEEDYCDSWIGTKAVEELQSFSDDQPWHLVVNFTGPHDPYDVLPSMEASWEGVAFPDPIANDQDDRGECQKRRRYYAAMLENIDQQIGRCLEVVRERGELEQTIIVYSSDHGEMLGDHNRWAKGVMEEGSTHIPLMLKGPGILKGKTINRLASLHDLCPTFLEFAGVEVPASMDAKSLVKQLRGESEEGRSYVTSGLKDWRMVVKGPYKYWENKDGEVRLYNLTLDPEERTPLAHEDHWELIEECREIIAKEVPFFH